jgi:EmrB/QacA subfamily drug resistance transporter
MTEQTTVHGPRSADSSTGTPARRDWWALTILCLAQFMVILDITVVNVALPSIGAELHLPAATLTWVITAYTVCFGGLLLLGGRLADAYGARRIFLIGLGLFTAASVASGLAAGAPTLIVSRAGQGVGAALLSPAALALVTTMFNGVHRQRALGVWSAVAAAGGAVGVLFGGVLTDVATWRWNFLINLPVGIGVAALAPVLVAPTRPRPGRMDLPGAALATLATGLVIFGIGRAGDDGWSSPATGSALLAGLVLAVAFLVVEGRSRHALVPLRLLTRRSLVAGQLTMLVASALMLSAFFLTSLYLQRVLHLSALDTGLIFTPVALVTLASTHVAVRALGRVSPAHTAATGLALAAVGATLLAIRPTGDGWYGVLPGLLMLALGAGACFVTATTTAMARVEHHQAGVTSGLLNTAHELGASIGVATVSAIAATSISLSTSDLSSRSSVTAGYDRAYLVCAAIAAAMAMAAPWLLPRAPVPATDGPILVH